MRHGKWMRWVLALLVVSLSSCRPEALGTSSRPADDGTVSLSARAVESTNGLAEMEIRIRAAGNVDAARLPVELVAFVDASESMTNRQMELARALVAQLVHLLDASDRFSLVVVADDARVDIELAPVTEEAKQAWFQRIQAIEPGGLTNLERALELTQTIASPDAHVVLISDGSPTWGSVTPDELSALVAERELWTVGVGRNNESLLRALGRYFYWVYADSCGLKTAFLGNGGRNAATIFSLRYSSSR